MIYEYRCTDIVKCGALFERIQSSSEPRRETVPCKYCQAEAQIQLSVPAVATANMTNQSLDVAIGRDAEARWARINERQEVRNKVRRESGQVGLTLTGANEYAPISTEQRETRNTATRAVEKDGWKATTDSEILTHFPSKE